MKKLTNARDMYMDPPATGFDIIENKSFQHEGHVDTFLPLIVGAAAVAVSAYGAYKGSKNAKEMGDKAADEQARSAEDNARVSRYDASVALDKAHSLEQVAMIDLKLQYQNIGRFLGTARAGYAARGVKVGTGSPLNVQIESLKAGLEDASRIIYNGNTAAHEARSLADRYMLLAEVGLRDAAAQGSLIRAAAGVQASNMMWQGAANALSGIASIASSVSTGGSLPYIPAT